MNKPQKKPTRAVPKNPDSDACTWIAARLLKLVENKTAEDLKRETNGIVELKLTHFDAWVVLRALATHGGKPED